MAAEPSSPGFRLLWVPIVMALIAAALVTLRGCRADHGPSTEARPEGSARESGRR